MKWIESNRTKHWRVNGAIASLCLLLTPLFASGQLNEFPATYLPCQYLAERHDKLKWTENHDKEVRIWQYWVKRPHSGTSGECDPAKYSDNACKRVTFVVKIKAKSPLGWALAPEERVLYHFVGGLEPGDLCLARAV